MRVTRKRVLLDTPEKSAASTRTSKRRKTPAVKNGVSTVFDKDDEVENCSQGSAAEAEDCRLGVGS